MEFVDVVDLDSREARRSAAIPRRRSASAIPLGLWEANAFQWL